jgi:hypothetical protein
MRRDARRQPAAIVSHVSPPAAEDRAAAFLEGHRHLRPGVIPADQKCSLKNRTDIDDAQSSRPRRAFPPTRAECRCSSVRDGIARWRLGKLLDVTEVKTSSTMRSPTDRIRS